MHSFNGFVILFAVLGKKLVKLVVSAVMEVLYIGVGGNTDHIILGSGLPDNAQSHIGAVVGDTLQVNEQLQELSTQFNGTFSLLEALHMAAFQGVGNQVHHFLQGLHLNGVYTMAGFIAGEGFFQSFVNCGAEAVHFALGLRGKG